MESNKELKSNSSPFINTTDTNSICSSGEPNKKRRKLIKLSKIKGYSDNNTELSESKLPRIDLENSIKIIGDRENSLNLQEIIGNIEIFIELPSGRTFTLNVKLSDTIQNIKSKIQCIEGIEPEHQDLTLKGNKLEDSNRTLDDYKIRNGTILHLAASSK